MTCLARSLDPIPTRVSALDKGAALKGFQVFVGEFGIPDLVGDFAAAALAAAPK